MGSSCSWNVSKGSSYDVEKHLWKVVQLCSGYCNWFAGYGLDLEISGDNWWESYVAWSAENGADNSIREDFSRAAGDSNVYERRRLQSSW